jgi:DNA replication licensing factor MCM3
VPAFDIALKEFVVELPDQLALGTVLDEYFVGFDGAFGGHTVTPRALNTNLLRCMVNVEGIITKLSLLKPKLVTSVHYSDGKKSNKPARRIVRQHRDITTSFGLPTAPVYPTRDEDDNILTIEYGMSQYRDYQKIVLQEMPEKAPPGQIPRSVEIICENDLCDVVKPGDRLSVVGIYRALPNMSDATQTKGVFSTVLLANNIQMLGKEISGPQLTPEDVANIKELAKNDAFKVLSQSLAPSIYGHDHIKKAILLQLVGGNEKNLVSSGIHLRGYVSLVFWFGATKTNQSINTETLIY